MWHVLCLLHQEAEKGIQKSKTVRPEKLRFDFSVKTVTKFSFFLKIRHFDPNMIYEKQISPFQG